MKKYIALFCLNCLLFVACSKQNFIANSGAYLYTTVPDDTLSFGTVFTSVGSVTQQFKIFNPNKQSIHIDEIKLSGGTNSYFQMNVNGNPGADFRNVDLVGGDSLYIFVAVNINANTASNPFVVSDSIEYSYNGHQQFVQLQACGQNAIFMNAQTINHDTTWTNSLPIVLLGNSTIANNVTLTINKGTKIYCHAKTIFEVDGTLIANGGNVDADRVLFTNDRLDDDYNEQTNQWRGINFGEASKGNILNNVTIKNAFTGIADTMNNAPQSALRLSLNGCVLTNHDYAALYFRNSNAILTNCLVANSNAQLALENGGNYSFNYCTFAGYGNEYVAHNNPSVVIENNPETGAASELQVAFDNSIIYGDDSQNDEIKTDAQGQSNFNIRFKNVLYKQNTALQDVSFSNCIQNADPSFLNVDGLRNEYDFRVQASSPAIGAAATNAVTMDILGQQRDAQKPTIGCYEFRN